MGIYIRCILIYENLREKSLLIHSNLLYINKKIKQKQNFSPKKNSSTSDLENAKDTMEKQNENTKETVPNKTVSFKFRTKDPVENLDGTITNWKKYLLVKGKSFQDQCNKSICKNYRIHDFTFRRTIGVGGFSRVVLAIKKDNQKAYSLKIIEKKHLIDNSSIHHLKEEIKILKALDFPFTLSLEYFFYDNSYLYLALPFIQGGDLFNLMLYVDTLTEYEARFYTAQIVYALEYLHHVGVLHRDMKLENIMIDDTGYIKIADFGLSKELKGKQRTYTFCGTPQYISPEMVYGRGYSYSTDWWSLGVIIYELCSGTTPFAADASFDTYMNIVHYDYTIPDHFSRELTNLIERLWCEEISKRLGCTRNSADEIKQASWFQSINWLDVMNRKLRPPYIPKLNDPLDDGLFDDCSNHSLKISKTDPYNGKFQNIYIE